MDFEIDYKERYVNMRNRYNELKNKMNVGVGCDKFKILFRKYEDLMKYLNANNRQERREMMNYVRHQLYT